MFVLRDLYHLNVKFRTLTLSNQEEKLHAQVKFCAEYLLVVILKNSDNGLKASSFNTFTAKTAI